LIENLASFYGCSGILVFCGSFLLLGNYVWPWNPFPCPYFLAFPFLCWPFLEFPFLSLPFLTFSFIGLSFLSLPCLSIPCPIAPLHPPSGHSSPPPQLPPPPPPPQTPLRARRNIDIITRENNIKNTQHSPTYIFLFIQGVKGLHSQQYREAMPMDPLHQDNFSVLTDFVNEYETFFKASTFINNTFFSSTMSLTKCY
jgi:hypothetical protein